MEKRKFTIERLEERIAPGRFSGWCGPKGGSSGGKRGGSSGGKRGGSSGGKRGGSSGGKCRRKC